MFGQILRKLLSEEALNKKVNYDSYADMYLESRKLKKPSVKRTRMNRKGMANHTIDPKIEIWLKEQ